VKKMRCKGKKKRCRGRKKRPAEPPQCVANLKQKKAIRCCADNGNKVPMGRYNKKCRRGTYAQAVAVCAAAGKGKEPAPDFKKVKGGKVWKCAKQGLGRKKSVGACAQAVYNNDKCLSGQFEFHRRYCKCVSEVPCTAMKGGRGFTTFELEKGDVQIHDTDRYWGCPRKGLNNKHGFGHNTLEVCADAVKDDEDCTTGQFDYNQKYKGQCKCVVSANDCTSVKGLRNYNTYSIIGFERNPPTTTTTTPGPTTTTTTICVPGTVDDSDICNHKTCVDDGSDWMVAHEDCPEDAGVQCPAGESYTAVEGECCKKCLFKTCETEGEVGTDVCPAGCVHVEDEDECKLAAAAWKKEFDDAPIPEGDARPTGCFRNRKYLIKFNGDNPTGGYKGKWPICKVE